MQSSEQIENVALDVLSYFSGQIYILYTLTIFNSTPCLTNECNDLIMQLAETKLLELFLYEYYGYYYFYQT